MHEEAARVGHRLIEVSHVAHRWSVSQEFVRRLIRSGQLPAILVGKRWRLAEQDIQAYLDGQRRGSQEDEDVPRLRAIPCSGDAKA